ncbi:inactive protein RESTRICTED TEV MOVEMENT 2-like [Hibiscus syriacus]|uniref:inactive protein RESTRICTED TEV MOVEMENT 2-like n=1 Tax=Hibiscus syriacus TaxID=106335 RepID=UPI001920597A|nr:inactive protein RESTRICTED TEV MOVEMENT 2-like [Hibiscus syriacus]
MGTRGSSGLSAQQQQSSAVQNFKPKSEWKHEEQASFLLLYLTGFAMDQLTITPDYSNSSVRVEGKRRLPNNRILPVDETYEIPRHLDLSKIDKQFGRGLLMLKIPRFPKLQSQQQSVEDSTKLDQVTTAVDPPEQKQGDDRDSINEKPEEELVEQAAKPERSTYEAAVPAMDEIETAKIDEGKREIPETQSAVKNNDNGVKDDVSTKRSKEAAIDPATKVEEKVKGNKETGKEDRALIINMRIAALILMGLGACLLYTLGH